MNNIVYNYLKIVDSGGDVVGVGATELGSVNETKFIEDIFELGYHPVAITKQEYDDYDGEETTNY